MDIADTTRENRNGTVVNAICAQLIAALVYVQAVFVYFKIDANVLLGLDEFNLPLDSYTSR